ncbi:MAG TPA: SIS domain-containing protein [Sporolactobacillaceae bacterium]|nr:SIS domain-containing protein [Sporolactobacillaceae bacterium]
MFEAYYQNYKSEFLETLESLDFSMIQVIHRELERARENDRQIFVLGNGGSAASASHWACDFDKGVNVGTSKRYRLLALTDNMPLVSAYGNDVDYNEIFVEQLKNFLNPEDLVIGLSVSGDSENLVRALRFAQEQKACVISLIGNREGRMKEVSDYALVIPSNNYGVVEDVHMYINHVISQYVKTQNEQRIKQL